ncbi:DUF3800 domain-containing protein [Mycoplasma sp. 1654_15]|uniref:DUF3800 domain-containing protein n=1 Tax=Mycoplasma sp. 1654_15 TaxID=2725994 RepID=UPI001449C173|nr:DUF3800 domain-containing protein [Mycoplasma sp. 1654_15]QJB71534.1 DUF3800 domain-containing protein [Mycoplasma sp. 1654_15]
MKKETEKIFIYLDESSTIELYDKESQENVFIYGGFYCLSEENCKDILNKATSNKTWIKTKQKGKEIKGRALHLKIKKELITFKNAIGVIAFLKILYKQFVSSNGKNYFKFFMISYLINAVIAKLISKKIIQEPIQIHLYLGQNKEVEKEDNWKETLKSKILGGLELQKTNYLTGEVKKPRTLSYTPDIFIKSLDSKTEEKLQLADVIANTLYQSYNVANLSWMNFCYTNFFNIQFIGDELDVGKLKKLQGLIHTEFFGQFWSVIECSDNQKE